jgi:tetratricopeptide (TPR) repeat protein
MRAPNWIARQALAAAAVLAVVAVGAGCVASGNAALSAGGPSARRDVDDARRLVQAGDAATAIPRLVHVISKYPESRPATEARYWLGVAYHRVRSYREAIELFEEYVALAPEGPHAADARDYIARLREEYDRKFLTPDEIDRRIADVDARLREAPGEPELLAQRAGLLWQRGNYEAAGQAYAALVRADPAWRDDETVRRRVDFHADGTYTVLDPATFLQRQRVANPLRIENTASFESGRDLFTQQRLFYVVTGQAYNQGDSTLYGVRVFVTIYGFGNVVYDSGAVHLGRLNPGERRAFSIRFSNFDNIENVVRYECEGSFER